MARAHPAPTPQPAGGWLLMTQKRLARVYDQFFTTHRREEFERIIVYLAALGFLLHLLLIFATNTLPAFASLRPVVGANYLGAIYTPFSFILFYEVLLLVLIIPESTTMAVGTQFQIISLITLRNVFKDIAAFDNLNMIAAQIPELRAVAIDMGGALILFLLVSVFYQVARWRTAQELSLDPTAPTLHSFIERKKIIALLLSALLFVLAALSIITWLTASYAVVFGGAAPPRTLTTIFYTDVFTVLIFTDVLVLILSLLLSNRYQLVFRNAGFVVATILLRISLSAEKPFDVVLALGALLFGVLVLLIYKYSSWVSPAVVAQRENDA